jgi:ABC-type multidrug transport system fused ATPase/permease subunit
MIGSAAVAQEAFIKILMAQSEWQNLLPTQRVHSLESADLNFEKVTFSFDKNSPPILMSVSFHVIAGSKVAIVGPSGAGKTTTFEIAAGFRSPTSGRASISGYSPKDIKLSLPGFIGIVPQRPHLISGTLAENISLENLSSTDIAKARKVLALAGLERLAKDGGKGVLTQVTPDFGEFSGGEIQRLGLARALYRDPKILFLDEATSALDAETESKVNQTLDRLRGNMTIVLIAHRLSTVMNADNIIYLDKGRVVAQGTFQELKTKVPDFAKAVELMDLRD